MKKTLFTSVIALAFSTLMLVGVCYSVTLTWGTPWRLFNYQDYFYIYANSSMCNSGVESIFFCKNKDSGKVVDHIYLKQWIYSNGSWWPQAEKLVLAPSATGWDNYHVCDPEVIKGEFRYNGVTYGWAMFYLGAEALGAPTCSNSQIGIAFANNLSGPWVKYSGNPIIPNYPEYADYWGVGWPSATSVNGKGRMLLFYTRQHGPLGSWTYRVDADFSDMNKPRIGPEVLLPTDGLTNKYGLPIDPNWNLRNIDMAYDSSRDKFFMIRPLHPYLPTLGKYIISDQLQVACIDARSIWTGRGTWQVLGNITPAMTGWPRNHNASIETNIWGGVINPNSMRFNFTCSRDNDIPFHYLWTYRIHSIFANLSDDALRASDKPTLSLAKMDSETNPDFQQATPAGITAVSPNPFNPKTEISISLDSPCHVSLQVFDLAGRKVRTLLEQELPAGSHQAEFDGKGLPSGTYFAVMKTDSAQWTRKIQLIK